MIDLSRGAIVLFADRGDYSSKPRPGVIVQHEASLAHAPSITLCGITTFVIPPTPTRIAVEPDAANGLQEISFVMVDKIGTVRRDRIRSVVGRLDELRLRDVDDALRRWLDL